MRETTHGWLISDGGRLRDENIDGLVFPASSGWRAVRTYDGKIRFVPPGEPLSKPAFEREINGRPTWLGNHEIGLCDMTSCYRLDVATRTVLETTPIHYDRRTPVAVAPDGKRWFTTQSIGHVTRYKIVNFNDRPWKP